MLREIKEFRHHMELKPSGRFGIKRDAPRWILEGFHDLAETQWEASRIWGILCQMEKNGGFEGLVDYSLDILLEWARENIIIINRVIDRGYYDFEELIREAQRERIGELHQGICAIIEGER